MRNVAAVVLAAGGSTRLGEPKQFLEWQGESLIQRVVRAAAKAGCAPVVVVAAEGDERMVAALGKTSVELIFNPDWRRGLGTSIRTGIQSLVRAKAEAGAVVLLTCDQPFVDASAIIALVEAWRESGKAMVASRYASTLGIPVLFDRSCFATLMVLADDAGAKGFIRSRLEETAIVEFEAGAFDIDTAADYERAKSQLARAKTLP